MTKSKPNLDQSLYSRNLSAATRALSDQLSALYHANEHLDSDAEDGYGSRTTLRAKMAWWERRGVSVAHLLD